MNRSLLCGCIPVLGLAWAFGATADGMLRAELDGPSFFETYNEEVPVSGTVVVGVVADAILREGMPKSLVIVPGDWALNRQICLTVTSRNGAYFSRNVYRVPENSGGQPVELPYTSSKHDVLANFKENELSMLAIPGDCRTSSSAFFVVNGSTDVAPGRIRIFLNSFGATDVYYEFEDRRGLQACSTMDSGRSTSFDFVCEIPWERADAERNVSIYRERFGRELPAVSLKLLPTSLR